MKYLKDYIFLHLNTVLLIVSFFSKSSFALVHGRYTSDIEEYELSLPHRVSSSGEFISFSLPQFFKHKFEDRFKRTAATEDNKLYYNIIFNGKDHHIELWPNHAFISPHLVTEVYRNDLPVSKRTFSPLKHELCHYVGNIKGNGNLPVAVSVCDGLAGYFTTDKGQYFIEPIAEHQANANGEHVHVIYKRKPKENPFAMNPPKCSTHLKWTDAWEQELKERYRKKFVKRNTQSSHRYLEILVVADKKFMDYHKNTNTETYILTIMNMVYKLYQDPSTGNLIDAHVVRVIYLRKPNEHLDLELSQNAEETLDSFCKWSKAINPKDINSPQHHDIAILLTRFDLCSDNMSDCNLMGLAFMAAACDADKSCAINEDNGITLGITVAHEVGHVMGCGHDNEEDSPCKPQNEAGENYIMAPFLQMQTTEWSPCSKKFMTELFENNLGDCLNDEPQESLFKQNDMPPGSVYDADYQCNVAFPGSKHCILEQDKICKRLFCKQDGATSCNSKGDPPADGTKCGENKWCFNGKCVEMGQRPHSVDGGWGSWKPFSECSRSCGAGVSLSERDCDNPKPAHGGRYCLGERKQVKLCNTQDCPAGTEPFRNQQCATFNSKPFQDRLHKWKPYFQPDNPCVLTCINENNVFVALAPRAKDGTPCKAGTKDICISGSCRKVGCDWVLDSNAVEDMCGECNGDGTHCKVIGKLYTDVGRGYVKIAKIPAKSMNIRVSERAASENTIAVAAEDEKTFYLNGNHMEEQNGDKDFGGVQGLYDHPSKDSETLFIPGPLIKPIVLYVVFYTQDNPGIEYKYAEPSSRTIKPDYIWEFVEFGDCSARCGPGIKTAEPVCTEKRRGKVSDKFCAKIPKPEPKTMECNVRKCTIGWKASTWSRCSGCNGKTGEKVRTIDCVKESATPGRDPVIVADALCTEARPSAKQVCCSRQPCKNEKRSEDEYEKKLSDLWNQWDLINTRNSTFNENIHNIKNELSPNIQERCMKKFKRTGSHYFTKYLVKPQIAAKREQPDCNNKERLRKEIVPGKRIAPQYGEGKAVKDHLPPEGNKVIEVPIMESHENVKLSDAAFEKEGDLVADTLDYCRLKVFTGQKADQELKKLKSQKKIKL